jgi:hypothetical protein
MEARFEDQLAELEAIHSRELEELEVTYRAKIQVRAEPVAAHRVGVASSFSPLCSMRRYCRGGRAVQVLHLLSDAGCSSALLVRHYVSDSPSHRRPLCTPRRPRSCRARWNATTPS